MRDLRPALLALAIAAAPTGAAPAQEAAGARRIDSPVSPEDSLALFSIVPGYRIEIAAAEPEVIDPIDLAFDAGNRLWVVEMGDYPEGPAPGAEPAGRIKILEDEDGDGRFESVRVFADGLLFATGAAPWKNGAFVTTGTEVLYLEDTDGDRRADARRTICDRFQEKNSQLFANNPTWGIDNRFTIANGLRNTDVRVLRPGEPAPLEIRGRDLSLDPATGLLETAAGMSQFGIAFDDEGRRFLCSNRNHLRQVVIPARYLARNPHLAIDDAALDIPEHGAAATVYPLSSNWTTSNLHAGTFTAACGVLVYRGDLLPGCRGDAFVCEPTGNLVHRDRLRSTGSAISARRVEEEREFLASPDEWFRPVNLASGPGGALYVADMYRAVIEHPHWMPPELQKRPDLRDGDRHGRIYRIVPAAAPAATGRPPPPALEGAALEALVEALSHPDGWRRDTAQRFLVERRDAKAAPLLAALAGAGEAPLGRLHALWTLEGIGALDAASIERALADPDPRQRRAALRLGEPFLKGHPGLRERALALAGDPDRGVRFQLALTIGEFPAEEALEPLAALARAEAEDPWFRKAILTAASERPGGLAVLIAGEPAGGGTGGSAGRSAAPRTPGAAELARELAAMTASRGRADAVIALLESLRGLRGPQRADWERAALLGLAEGAGRRGKSVEDLLGGAPGGEGARAIAAEIFAECARAAADAAAPAAARLECIRLLRRAPSGAHEVLAAVIDSERDPELRAAAVRSLASSPRDEAAERILERWRGLTPALRREALGGLVSRTASAARLLDAVEEGRAAAAEIDPAHRQQLQRHSDAAIRERARKILGPAAERDRAAVIAAYRKALDLPADLARGRGIFEKNCATCHRVAGIGTDTGPDISDTRERTAEALLIDILDPNRAIDGAYISYAVATRDRRVLAGIIASETPTAITLRRAEGETETVLRGDIRSLSSTGTSLMPEGLEREIGHQEMADLIKFLKDWRY